MYIVWSLISGEKLKVVSKRLNIVRWRGMILSSFPSLLDLCLIALYVMFVRVDFRNEFASLDLPPCAHKLTYT